MQALRRWGNRWWALFRLCLLEAWEHAFGVACKGCGAETKDPYKHRWEWGRDPVRPAWRCAECVENEEDKEDESWWMN